MINMAQLSADQIQLFLLSFVRVLAMITLLPVFGSQAVPGPAKAGLAFCVAVILHPFITLQPGQTATRSVPTFVFAVVKEAAVGVVIGYAASLLFAAVQFAGRLIDTQMGFALVQVIDPFTQSSVTTTGQLFTLLFSVLFLLLNGHYFMLLAIKKSFELIPLLGVGLPTGNMASLLVDMTGEIFALAVRLAAPVFVVLVLTSLSLGVVARTVPQMNVFFVGLPLRIGVGLTTIILVFPALTHMFRGIVDGLVRNVWRLLYLMS
jgi:flagellar biosynthetic protein FliR